jgi:uncharacterized protein YjbJ (UPF0337 family)
MYRYTKQGDRKQVTAKVKAQMGKPTVHRFKVIDGKCVEVSGKIQHSFGIARNITDQQIERFKDRNQD